MINTEFLEKCIKSLELSYKLLKEQDSSSTLYDVYRSATVKKFELILEQSGKLLKKSLYPYFVNNKEVDKLTFKNIFRYGHKHNFIDENAVLRWFEYRDSRNETAHNYGKSLAQKTIEFTTKFIIDSKNLIKNIKKMLLKKKYKEDLIKIFRNNLNLNFELLAYGSRVNGRAHSGSDLDLVIKTDNNQPIDTNNLIALKNKLSESNIPFLVDVLDWNRIPDYFQKNILKKYEILK